MRCVTTVVTWIFVEILSMTTTKQHKGNVENYEL